MATVPEHVHDATIGAGYRRWTALLKWLAQVSPWFVVVAYIVTYAILLFMTAIGVGYMAAVLPGMVGVVTTLTIGIIIISAAPSITQALLERAIDDYNAPRYRGLNPKDGDR